MEKSPFWITRDLFTFSTPSFSISKRKREKHKIQDDWISTPPGANKINWDAYFHQSQTKIQWVWHHESFHILFFFLRTFYSSPEPSPTASRFINCNNLEWAKRLGLTGGGNAPNLESDSGFSLTGSCPTPGQFGGPGTCVRNDRLCSRIYAPSHILRDVSVAAEFKRKVIRNRRSKEDELLRGRDDFIHLEITDTVIRGYKAWPTKTFFFNGIFTYSKVGLSFSAFLMWLDRFHVLLTLKYWIEPAERNTVYLRLG